MTSTFSYLSEIETAVTAFLDAMWKEHKLLTLLRDELTRLEKDSPARNSAGEEEIKNLERIIGVHEFSANVLAGDVLQYAMQRANSARCPEGRQIHGRSLRDLIWFGRTQAIQHERWTYASTARRRASLTPETEKGNNEFQWDLTIMEFFRKLKDDVDPPMLYHPTVFDLSFMVVNLLNWKDFESFKKDMLLLER